MINVVTSGSVGTSIVEVDASRPACYTVHTTRGATFDPDRSLLPAILDRQPAFFVIDDAVLTRDVRHFVGWYPASRGMITIPGGEQAKSWSTVEQVCGAAFAAPLDRSGVIVAVGGGAVLDAAGFSASVYRRGVNVVRVPTTLVGMVDVAVGIKHAINFAGKKNGLGSFYPCKAALCDLAFLNTLDRRQIAAGLAEIIKIALVADEPLFDLVERSGAALCASSFAAPWGVADDVVVRAQRALIDELAPNLYEHDRRRLADFGHTFSPAIETASRYAVLHGEAVALDMLLSTAIGVLKGLSPPALLSRLRAVCSSVHLPVRHAVCTPSVIASALYDTRLHRGALNLVVPLAAGRAVFVQDVDDELLAAAADLLADPA